MRDIFTKDFDNSLIDTYILIIYYSINNIIIVINIIISRETGSKAYNRSELRATLVRFLISRLSISSKSSNFLILKLYRTSIRIKIVKLYLIELFRMTISYDSITNY